MQADCRMDSSSSLLPEYLHPIGLADIGMDVKQKYCQGTGLMPPAVEPGLPPMNIRMADRICFRPSGRRVHIVKSGRPGRYRAEETGQKGLEPFIPTRNIIPPIR